MKSIIINESQYSNILALNEDTREDFSLAYLDSIDNVRERANYCVRCLGSPIGSGSSRAVWLLSDEHVLKMANIKKFDAGCMQNKVEYITINNSEMKNSLIFPRIYQHADDFSWLVSEHVIEAEIIDFIKILGIPFDWYDEGERIIDDGNKIPVEDDGKYDSIDYDAMKKTREYRTWDLVNYKDYEKYEHPVKEFDEDQVTFMDFVRWVIQTKTSRELEKDTTNIANKCKSLLMPSNPNHQWFREIFKYIQMNDGYCDFDIGNFGITLRDGRSAIVLLDSGFDKDVLYNFY